MPHVLVAGKLHPSGIALLDQAEGVTYDYVEDISEPSYSPLIGEADGLVIRTQPMGAETISAGGNLKIVSRHGVGYDAVDVGALNARNIPLAIVGDVNSSAVAEHTMTLLLAAAKRVLRYDAACRGKRPWGYRNSLEAQEVAGKTLLIVGFGRIGRHLAQMAQGFGYTASYLVFMNNPDKIAAAEIALAGALVVLDGDNEDSSEYLSEIWRGPAVWSLLENRWIEILGQ